MLSFTTHLELLRMLGSYSSTRDQVLTLGKSDSLARKQTQVLARKFR